MSLFDMRDGRLIVTPEEVVIPPYNKIWERDKSSGKSRAIREISYIYFMCNYKSPYLIYDKEERHQHVAKDFLKSPDWEADPVVLAGLEKYNEFNNTTSMRLLSGAKQACNKLTKYYEAVDFAATDDTGKLLYSIRDVTSSLEKVGKIVESLTVLENKVKKEVQTESKIRGGGQVGEFEDPD